MTEHSGFCHCGDLRLRLRLLQMRDRGGIWRSALIGVATVIAVSSVARADDPFQSAPGPAPAARPAPRPRPPVVQPEPVVAPAPTSPANPTQSAPAAEIGTVRFDGIWVMTVSCPNTPDGITGYARRFTMMVSRGHFRAQYGTMGQVDSVTYEGTVQADGRLGIFGSGLTGPSATAPGHPPAGSPFGFTATGRLDDTSGTATRNEGRVCNFTFVKQ